MSSDSNNPKLLETDIPGSSLGGRAPANLKVEELKFWLKCRGDPAKGLKTKAQLVKRVEEYIKAGKDKNIVDPDENKVYTKRKQRQDKLNSIQTPSQHSPKKAKFPDDGWSSSLKRMPPFNRAEMDAHITKSGKIIDPQSKGHSLPTGLTKAKTFLADEYLKEIKAASDNGYFYFKSLCHHSFRKNEPPHKLKIALDLITAEVIEACCTCVAGKVGLCNHVLALMLKLCKFSLYACNDIKDLDSEDDVDPHVACTSNLQVWHKTGRGDKITPKPIMEVMVKKPKLDDSTANRPGLKCLLYEARSNLKSQLKDEKNLKADLMAINPNMPLAQILD
uniref:Uncharacterized protein LOC116305611 n=1 Tax=Actinia tenebrosa TaxID=6105 RepID=A0A6P8IVU1_ACTTE